MTAEAPDTFVSDPRTAHTYIHTCPFTYTFSGCPDGSFVEVSNRLFDASFFASRFLFEEMLRRKTVTPFLFLRCALVADRLIDWLIDVWVDRWIDCSID